MSNYDPKKELERAKRAALRMGVPESRLKKLTSIFEVWQAHRQWRDEQTDRDKALQRVRNGETLKGENLKQRKNAPWRLEE